MPTLEIGILSYKNLPKLQKTISLIKKNTDNPYKITVVHNPSDGPENAQVVEAIMGDPTLDPIILPTNLGYAGGVNTFLRNCIKKYSYSSEASSIPRLVYFDNDAYVTTQGWDSLMLRTVNKNPKIGMMFPNGGPYPISRPGFTEVLWGVGYCWMTTIKAITDVGLLDEAIGHQEEADFCMRMRMNGYVCAAIGEINVQHDATATTDPAAQERINRGVVNFVDKWNRYFVGKTQGYHSPNVLRWEDWPPNAIYLEEFYQKLLPDLNKNPEVINVNGASYDLIKVLRFKEYYRGRII